MFGVDKHGVEVEENTLPVPSQMPNVYVVRTRFGELDVVLLLP